MNFGDIQTTFILWNDVQIGMMFIRPFEGVIHCVEKVEFPFIHIRQSITGYVYVVNSWRGIQALDYSVPTELETIVREFIVREFKERATSVGSEFYFDELTHVNPFDQFMTSPQLPDVAFSCDQEDRTIRPRDIEMRNIFTEIEHGKTETGKTPLEDILFDVTLREAQREKYSRRNKKRFIDFPLGDTDFQPKRREKED